MPGVRVGGSATWVRTARGIGKETGPYAMGVLQIAVVLSAAILVAAIPFVLVLITAFGVYRKLKIVGFLVYLLILFTAWLTDGRDGLLVTNVFLFCLLVLEIAVRGAIRNIRVMFDLASEGFRNGQAIAAAGSSSPTAGGVDEEKPPPKAVDKRDHEHTRPRLSEAGPSEFDLLGEPSRLTQVESLPPEAYELEFQLDRMNQIADRAGDAYGGQHVHPDNSPGLAELQKVLHATIWIPESPSPTLETFDTNTAMIRRIMEFPAGTKIWARWKYSEIGYGLRVGEHGLPSYLHEAEFAHYDWHSVHQEHPGTGDGISSE